MKWRDVNHTHNGLTAIVKDPINLRTPIMGVIKCEKEGETPRLADGSTRVHMFSGANEVEIID